MARKRRSRKKKQEEVANHETGSANRLRGRRIQKTGHWFSWKLRIGLVLVLAILFFLPSIVARTPLKQVAINWALANFDGKVTVESISCGWFSSTRLENVKAVDSAGDLLFSVAEVKTKRSLTSLPTATDLGTIEINRPVINLKVRHDGSNLEDAIAGMMNAESTDSGIQAMQLAVTCGKATVTDMATGAFYELHQIESDIRLFQPSESPFGMEVRAIVPGPTDADAGFVNATLIADANREQIEFENGRVHVQVERLPTDLLSPFLSRFVGPMQVTGSIDQANAKLAWDQGGALIEADLKPVSFSNVQVFAPQLIGQDRIQLQTAWLQGKMELTPDKLMAEKLVCTSDLGQVKADGSLNWQQLSGTLNAKIPANNFRAEGELHLKPLIAMLPSVLPLQSGIEIESGVVKFDTNSRVENTDRRLVLNVESDGLTARHHGRRMNWSEPARIAATIRQTSDNRTLLESLLCNLGPLQLRGSATREGGEFTIDGDLKAAMDEARQFFDFGDSRIQGIVQGKFAWQFEGRPDDALANRPLVTGGELRITDPLLELPGQVTWSDKNLKIDLRASGQMVANPSGQGHVVRLDRGELNLENANQNLLAILQQPVLDPSLDSIWSLTCRVRGQVGTWLNQVRTMVSIQADASGFVDATANIRVSPNQVSVDGSQVEIRDLEFDGYGINLSETAVTGSARANFDMQTGNMTITEASLEMPAIVARAQDLAIETSNNESRLNGQVVFQADVNRCLAALAGPAGREDIHWYGQARGAIQLATDRNSIGGDVQIQVNDLVATKLSNETAIGMQNVSSASPWVRLLDEKSVRLDSGLSLASDFTQIRFQNTRLTSSAAELTMTGTIADLNGLMNCRIAGNWQPNWQRLQPLVDSLLGDVASVQGVQGGEFQVQGPLFNEPGRVAAGESWINPALQVAASTGWQSGQVLGMNVGGSRANIQLAGGIVAVQSSDIRVGQAGVARLNPQIDMRGSNGMLLGLPSGQTLENIQLTPELCRGWMKFVAPILADATEAQGSFSVNTENVRVPLGQLAASTATGTATLHGADIGPGPLSQQLITLVSQVRLLAKGQPLAQVAPQSSSPWIRIPEQRVPFSVSQGRVSHQGLQFQIDDVLIQTYGSVGLDQTLQMTAVVPVLDSWVGNSRWTQGLRGQSIQVPIIGTVSNPRLDSRVLQQISRQVVQQAATSAVQTEIQGQVQGLFDQGGQKIEQELSNGLRGLFGGDKQ